MAQTIDPELPAGVLRTARARLSFPFLDKPEFYTPGKPKPNEKPKYRACLILAKGTDSRPYKELLRAAGKQYFGPDEARWPRNMRPLPIKPCSEGISNRTGKPYAGMDEGEFFINVSSERPPGLIRMDRTYIDTPAAIKMELYAGCWVRATLNAYGYGGGNTGFQPGISFGLRSIQKLGDGPPLGGIMVTAEEEFAPSEEFVDDRVDRGAGAPRATASVSPGTSSVPASTPVKSLFD